MTCQEETMVQILPDLAPFLTWTEILAKMSHVNRALCSAIQGSSNILRSVDFVGMQVGLERVKRIVLRNARSLRSIRVGFGSMSEINSFCDWMCDERMRSLRQNLLIFELHITFYNGSVYIPGHTLDLIRQAGKAYPENCASSAIEVILNIPEISASAVNFILHPEICSRISVLASLHANVSPIQDAVLSHCIQSVESTVTTLHLGGMIGPKTSLDRELFGPVLRNRLQFIHLSGNCATSVDFHGARDGAR